MKRRSDESSWEEIRDQVIGLGEHSARKSYYPELQQRIHELEQTKATLATANQHLEAVMASASEFSIIATDCSGIITLFNRGAEKMLGYTASEVIGRQTPLLLHLESEVEQRRAELSQEVGHAVESFEVFCLKPISDGSERREWTYRRKDGSQLLVNLTVTVMHDEAGTITGFLGIAEDITRRKATEKLLVENEELLGSIINSIPNPVFYKDAQGRYTGCNDAFCSYLGYPREKIIGSTVFELAPRKLAEGYHKADLELLQKGGTQKYQTAMRYADNTLHEVMLYKSCIKSRDNAIVGLVGVMLDITEQKQVENELRQQEELFHLLFEKSGDGNLLIDGTTIIDCNEATVRMLGFPDKQLLLDLHPGDISPEYQPDGLPSSEKANHMMLQAYEHGSHRFEWVHRKADGTDLHVEVMLTAIPMHQRWLLHTAWRDLTERKLAEHEREILNQSLLQAQKMESIGRLAGGVAHDFNNLLSPIMGYAEMIRASMPPDHRNYKRIQGVLDAALKARDLTHQLLAFSRKQLLEMKVISMNDVIEKLFSILRRTIRENIEIKLNLDREPKCLMGDRTQLEQIIMNVVINAQDAIPDGGIIEIETTSTLLQKPVPAGAVNVPAGNYVVLTMKDSGVGIDPETIKHIFEPFYTTKPQGKGTGLGLATVFGIVKQHGGYILVESEPGTGTSFRLFFPVVAGHASPATSLGQQVDSKARSGAILLVEDNEMVRDMTRELLVEKGFTILTAADSDEAFQIMTNRKEQLDLLLSDVIMPKMSGPALYEKLKVLQPGLKVLYMSGYTENVIADYGMLAEDENYIQKPFSSSSLIDRIDRIISQDKD